MNVKDLYLSQKSNVLPDYKYEFLIHTKEFVDYADRNALLAFYVGHNPFSRQSRDKCLVQWNIDESKSLSTLAR